MSASASMQSVIDSAHNEGDVFVAVGPLQDLENGIEEQRAIELATYGLLSALKRAHREGYWSRVSADVFGDRFSIARCEWETIRSAVHELRSLIGLPE